MSAPIKKLRLKKTDEVTTAKKRPKLKPKATPQGAIYFIPGFPIEDGPIKYTVDRPGDKLLDVTDPACVVVLDRGTFQYVWEMLESRARADHQKYRSIPSLKRVTEEAVRSFRKTAHDSLAVRPSMAPKTKPKLKLVKKKLRLKGGK